MKRFRVGPRLAAVVLLALALANCGGFGGFSSFRNSGNAPETVPVEPEAHPNYSYSPGRWLSS